ncbi:serine hydrolase domain-containing protein [Hugenholtzia roseola]|uniref:serine hydrolase domain-containing protein n=1 Tax=Hugenholtzia roseola TaxID=1002 RepID=UPI00041C23DF|nr:serine hydrolase [Hugenholtzia roseola]
MKKILLFSALVVFLLLIAGAIFAFYFVHKLNNLEDTQDLEKRVTAAAEKFLKEKKSVGLAIAIVQGEKSHLATYGWANKEAQIPVKEETIFEIGSISKVFTTQIGEILAQKGVIDWNSTLAASLQSPFSFQDDKTTLLHLATHTSGFPRLPQHFLDRMTDDCNPYSTLTQADLVAYLAACKDKKEASLQAYDYSNFGSALLGTILVQKSKKDYETLLQDEICTRLGLKNTSLLVKDSTKFAIGYTENQEPTCHWDFPEFYAAGGIRSDIADMGRFLKAQLSDNQDFKNTHAPIFEAQGGKIGKGWHLDTSSDLILKMGDIVWHNGGTGGFRTYIGFSPEKNIGVVVLANQSSAEVDNFAIKILAMTKQISLSK